MSPTTFLRFHVCTALLVSSALAIPEVEAAPKRPRARELGIIVGEHPPGPLNAITDVPGIRVGQITVVEGTAVHTGVTVIHPHEGNVFLDRVPAALHVGNGYGKLLGVTQLRELGELETPIALTGTLSVWRVADAMTTWMLAQPGMEEVRSINPVVGETNDGFLSDIRARPIRAKHVINALEGAKGGTVEEGSVGAGAGTVTFGYKGGIGTSSRMLAKESGGYTVGVLVQSNFGGDLTIGGAPVGRELERAKKENNSGDGSIMIIVATDAPLNSRNLERLAARTMTGLARTGSNMSNGSGDYAIAFSTASECRRRNGVSIHNVKEVPNSSMTPLFEAVAEATEEAIYNSLLKATSVKGHRGTTEALPLEPTTEILKKAGVLQPAQK